MQATSSLTAYAGQTVVLAGQATINIYDFDILFEGSSSLYIADNIFTSITFEAESFLYPYASYNYGYSDLPAITSIGRAPGVDVSLSNSTLPALTSTGEGDIAFDPEDLISGYGNLPVIVSSGIVTQTNVGDGDADLPALTSLGGDYVYGISGPDYLPALLSFGHENYVLSGLVNIPNIYIDPYLSVASATESYVCTGDIRLKKFVVEGYTGHSGFIELPTLEISGVALADHVALGDIRYKSLVVNGTAYFEALSSGYIEFKLLKVESQAVFIPVINGSIILNSLMIKGAGYFSPLGDKAGNIVFPMLKVTGEINNHEAPLVLKYTRNPTC